MRSRALRLVLLTLVFAPGCGGPAAGTRSGTAPKTGVLEMKSQPDVWTASDADAFDQLQKACNRSDETALRALIASGRVQVHARGTRVTVVEEGALTVRVRIEDDTPHRGRVYVTWPEFVKR
jgi:hypothetical protein